jgi:hypoxanthine-guanine phosphoribosyltransferase
LSQTCSGASLARPATASSTSYATTSRTRRSISTTEIDFLSWIQLVALIDRPDARTVDLTVDFGGFEGSEGAYVGYGLEIEGRHGNLPYLALVS